MGRPAAPAATAAQPQDSWSSPGGGGWAQAGRSARPGQFAWKAGQPSGAGDCAFKSFFQLWNGAWGDGECTLGEVALHGPAHALCQMQKS